jgi:hypothetical protein
VQKIENIKNNRFWILARKIEYKAASNILPKWAFYRYFPRTQPKYRNWILALLLGKKMRIWPKKINCPIFIVGCPRSGTTFLGRVISSHPEVYFLNEPCWLWSLIEAKCDIWGCLRNPNKGVLLLSERDYEYSKADLLSRSLEYLRVEAKKSILLEKTPENAARMGWINKMLPDCKFIHIIRHPNDVALSWEKAIVSWYGEEGWGKAPYCRALKRHAQINEDFHRYLEISVDNYDRGLAIWNFFVKQACKMGRSLPRNRYIEVRYEEFVKDPVDIMERLFRFISLPYAKNTIEYVHAEISDASVSKPIKKPGVMHEIAGSLMAELGYS